MQEKIILYKLINCPEFNKKTVSNSKLIQKWLKNLTGIQIPENVTKVASSGIYFGVIIQRREILTYNIIADMESDDYEINTYQNSCILLKK